MATPRTSPAGWVPLPRRLLHEPIWDKPPSWLKILIWLRCSAAWRDTETCSAGQVRATYNADQLPGVTNDQWRACLAYLEDSGQITIKRERYGLLITLSDNTQPAAPAEAIDDEFRAWFARWPVQRQIADAQRAYRHARAKASASDLEAGRDRLLDAIRFNHIASNRVPYAHRWLRAERWTDVYSAPKRPTNPVDWQVQREIALRYWSEKLWEARLNTAESESVIAACRKATATIPKHESGESVIDGVLSLVNHWKEHRK